MVATGPDEAGFAAAIERDGFAILRGYLPAAPCLRLGEAILEECARLTRAGWKFVGGGRWEGNRNVLVGGAGREVWDAAVARGLPDLIAATAGRAVVPTAMGGNLAMPGSRAQNFHIDGDFANPSWIANIALVATTPENGMTALVPGSHRSEATYRAFRRGGQQARAVQPSLGPGDALVRLSTVWHRGTTNRTARARPFALISYAPADAPGDDAPAPFSPDPRDPLTVCANRYYGRSAMVRELAAVRLPWLYEALRLARP